MLSSQFVFLPFTMDEKAASSIAFRVHDLTDPHATDPASFLWEPSPAGVISGHNHSLDTHNIAVTAWCCHFPYIVEPKSWVLPLLLL